MLIDGFLTLQEQYEQKESDLSETIVDQNKQLVEMDKQYKEYLRNGQEEEADNLFHELQQLKMANQSCHQKLKTLKEVHSEILVEQAKDMIASDVPKLKKQYDKQAEAVVNAYHVVDEQKRKAIMKENELRQEIKEEASRYEYIIEEFGLSKDAAVSPYKNGLSYLDSRIIDKAFKKGR